MRTLYIVPTPIGNLEDITLRAVNTLRAVQLIAAEDTRRAAILLSHLDIHTPVTSYFEHNKLSKLDRILSALEAGDVALISEAGTPGLSDPGYELIRAAIERGHRVVPLPGATAAITALVASGLPTDSFFFAGFPPRKSGARRLLLERLRPLPATLIFYESPHRVGTTLAEAAAALGEERPACLARELTKTHEELVRGTLGELARRYAEIRPLGEVTLLVGGASDGGQVADDEATLAARAKGLLATGMSARDVADTLAAESQHPRREIYQLVLAVRR